MPSATALFVLFVLICARGVAGREMVFPAAEWARATPESAGLDPDTLRAAIAYMDDQFGPEGAKELAIVRRGRLIWEGPDADAYHPIFSCTKTFTSTILGLLIDDGKCTLDTRAVEVLPELDDEHPRYARIRLRHLASMTGGYCGEVREVSEEQPWGDPLAYFLPVAPRFEAGTRIEYHDHDVHLLGRIIMRLAGEPLADVFRGRIADPIGVTRWDWGVCGALDGLTYCNAAGTPCARGGGGIRTTARQFARYGYLYLNRGRWDGRQLLSAEFVDEATCSHVPADLPGRSNRLLAGRYGLYWWTNGVRADGTRPWPSAPAGAYTPHGRSANFCFVIPEWEMVIARTGSTPIAESGQGDALWEGFFSRLAEAMAAAPR
jgi:CubicO group peptidase (beta-lactamase class C family)